MNCTDCQYWEESQTVGFGICVMNNSVKGVVCEKYKEKEKTNN